MCINLKFHEGDGYIEISVDGKFSLQTLKNLAKKVTTYVKVYNCKFILNDLRNATLIDSPVSIYSMPKVALNAGIEREIKRAILVKKITPNYLFLETVFINQGNIVKIFDNFDKAKSWLLKKIEN